MHAKKQRNIPQPSNPLKSFNWAKLPENQVTGTIWQDIDDAKVSHATLNKILFLVRDKLCVKL